MAYGNNTPRYGYVRSAVNGSGTGSSPYYRMAQALAQKSAADPFGLTALNSPNNRAGMFGADPFSTPANHLPPGGNNTAPPSIGGASLDARAGGESYPNQQNLIGGGGQRPAGDAQPPLYDLNSDPILNQIRALSTQSRQDAEGNALRLKKQLAIAYGDTSLAKQIGDQATGDAADQNPFSVTKLIKGGYDRNAQSLDESLNKDNLFYSGERVKDQGRLTDQYQQDLAQALAQEQSSLGDIEGGRLASILGANSQDVAALTDAEKRQVDVALANGFSFGGWDGSGKPILLPPGGQDGAAPAGGGAAAPPPVSTGAAGGARTGSFDSGDSLAAALAVKNAGSGIGPLRSTEPAANYGPGDVGTVAAGTGAAADPSVLARALARKRDMLTAQFG